MKIDLERLIGRLEELYACGLQEDGTHTRMAFSREDEKGRELFLKYAGELGISGRTDEAGNLILRLEGEEPELPAILIGSHLDTVPDGGKYDGALGCMAALGVLETYIREGKRPKHPIETLVFTDEEGFRFGKGLLGSGAFSGIPTKALESDMDKDGITRGEAFEKCGLSLAEISKAKRDPASVLCSLELHIEQGASLDREQIPVGIVSSIAGVRRFEVTVTGEANHSGSTAMGDRHDALVTASDFICRVPETAVRCGNKFTVATVGTIKVEPHSVNVIPGLCRFSLEIRDQDVGVMDAVEKELRERMEDCCRRWKTTCTWRQTDSYPPRPMTGWVREAAEAAVQKLGYPYEVLPSGAFHDSLLLSTAFPAGMIFVPSVGGLSHSRREYTGKEDIGKGLDVLMETVLLIDGMTGQK